MKIVKNHSNILRISGSNLQLVLLEQRTKHLNLPILARACLNNICSYNIVMNMNSKFKFVYNF